MQLISKPEQDGVHNVAALLFKQPQRIMKLPRPPIRHPFPVCALGAPVPAFIAHQAPQFRWRWKCLLCYHLQPVFLDAAMLEAKAARGVVQAMEFTVEHGLGDKAIAGTYFHIQEESCSPGMMLMEILTGGAFSFFPPPGHTGPPSGSF